MNDLINIVENHPKIFDLSGKKSHDLIAKAEFALDVRLPKSYKDFVMNFGKLAFGSRTYLGIIHENFERSGLPDVVWYNLLLRRQYGFPQHLIVVLDEDGVLFTCLDTSNYYSQDECALVMWDNVHKKVIESVNVNFIDYLLEVIEDQLDELIEEYEEEE